MFLKPPSVKPRFRVIPCSDLCFCLEVACAPGTLPRANVNRSTPSPLAVCPQQNRAGNGPHFLISQPAQWGVWLELRHFPHDKKFLKAFSTFFFFSLFDVLRHEARVMEGLHRLGVEGLSLHSILKLNIQPSEADYAVDIRSPAISVGAPVAQRCSVRLFLLVVHERQVSRPSLWLAWETYHNRVHGAVCVTKRVLSAPELSNTCKMVRAVTFRFCTPWDSAVHLGRGCSFVYSQLYATLVRILLQNINF